MRKHPMYAKQLLSSIEFLQDAIEIHTATMKNGMDPVILKDYTAKIFPWLAEYLLL